MNFTAEQLKKINEAKTAEELIALAKAEGIEISEEEIKAKFAEMHNEGEIADDELDNVAGGGCAYRECLVDNGQYMRIRKKTTQEEFDVYAKGCDLSGSYLDLMDENGNVVERIYGNYEIVATGASASF